MKTDDWKSALAGLAADMGPLDHDSPTGDIPETPQNAKETACLLITMERKGRGGKTATIISGFTISDEEVSRLASKLKTRLGTGGSARGGEILIQGDRRKDVAAALNQLGFKTKGVTT